MTTTFSIREPIGRPWRDELIWLPLPDAGPGRVVNAGTGEALPTQVAGTQVCVRVSLAPDEHLQLRVEPGAVAAVASPFTVDEQQVSNGVITARLPATGSFDPGAAPGPVVALQRHGRWIGQGVWGTCDFTGRIETTITDRGPLFARWVTRYIVAGQVFARYECTLYAGEDFVRVRDETKLGAGMAFRFRLTGPDAPTEWFTYGGGEADNVVRGTLDNPPDHKGRERGNEFLHIDFNSAHFQMSYTWVGFIVNDQAALGICELRGGHWEMPGRNRIRVLRTTNGVAFVFPADGGSKEFALVAGDPAAYAPAKGGSRFRSLRSKYSDLPLEKVRHWVTDWPLRPYDRPILYPRGTAERWREKLDAWPELAAAYRERTFKEFPAQLVQYLLTGDRTKRDALLAKVDENLRKGVEHAFSSYLRLIIFDGRTLKVNLEVIDVLRWRGELDDATARTLARRAAFIAYCFADPDFWPWNSMFRDRDDLRSIGAEYWDDMGPALCPPNFSTEYYTSFGLMGLAYPEHPAARGWVDQAVELFERNLSFFFYEGGGYTESVNYHAHELSMLTHLAVGLWAGGERDFFEHPRFKATYGFMLDMLTPRGALTDRGVELATAPAMLNPPRDRRGVLITNWGNSGFDCSGFVVPIVTAIAAGVYADLDPAYAQRLMTAWRLSAQELTGHYLALHLIALGRPDLPDVPLNLGSKLVESLGAVMRASETFAWVKCGIASNHNCRDEGGLVLYAHGAPILGDIGYHTQHEGRTVGGSDTWEHACVTFGDRRSLAYLGNEVRQPPELWRSTPEADLLVAYLPVEYLVPEKKFYLDVEPIPRIEHRRFILFVKPHCLVIYDHIPQTTLPSTWWLHALADAVETGPQRARFRGRYDVDLDVQILLPTPAPTEQGVLGVQRHLRIDQPGVGDYLTVLSPLPAGKPGPTATYLPQQHLLRVQSDWGQHQVVLDPVAKSVMLDGLKLL